MAAPGLFSAGEAALAEVLGWPLSAFRRCWQEIESSGLARADWSARQEAATSAQAYIWVDSLRVKACPQCGAAKGGAIDAGR